MTSDWEERPTLAELQTEEIERLQGLLIEIADELDYRSVRFRSWAQRIRDDVRGEP